MYDCIAIITCAYFLHTSCNILHIHPLFCILSTSLDSHKNMRVEESGHKNLGWKDVMKGIGGWLYVEATVGIAKYYSLVL